MRGTKSQSVTRRVGSLARTIGLTRGVSFPPIHHKELYFTANQVSSLAQFRIESRQEICPFNESLFPWLCYLGDMFEKYRFTNLSVRWVSGTSAVESGTIGIAIDLDPTDVSPTSMAMMSTIEHSKCGKVSNDLTVSVPRQTLEGWRWTHSEGENDIRLSSVGSIFFTAQSTSKLSGTLEIEYTIEFTNPSTPTDDAVYADMDIAAQAPIEVPWVKIIDLALTVAQGLATYFTRSERVGADNTVYPYYECRCPPGEWDFTLQTNFSSGTGCASVVCDAAFLGYFVPVFTGTAGVTAEVVVCWDCFVDRSTSESRTNLYYGKVARHTDTVYAQVESPTHATITYHVINATTSVGCFSLGIGGACMAPATWAGSEIYGSTTVAVTHAQGGVNVMNRYSNCVARNAVEDFHESQTVPEPQRVAQSSSVCPPLPRPPNVRVKL